MMVPFGLTDAEVASREQRAINEAEYEELARRMIDKYKHIEGFDGNFPNWLIGQEIGARKSNNTVRGVYEAATRLLGREADRSTPEEQAEAQARWELARQEGELVMSCLHFLYARGTTSSLKVCDSSGGPVSGWQGKPYRGWVTRVTRTPASKFQ